VGGRVAQGEAVAVGRHGIFEPKLLIDADGVDYGNAAAAARRVKKHGLMCAFQRHVGQHVVSTEQLVRRGADAVALRQEQQRNAAQLLRRNALFLMLERRLYEANVKSREGSFKTKGPADFPGNEINGKTFGQIGMGNIAQRIAYIMGTGFHCKVLGYDPFVSAEDALKRGFEKVETVEELLERSDLVNVNVPLVKSTRNLVSREAMAHFKPGSVFVNAARGEVIDEDALYDALVEGRLRAAACDTFVEEPVSPDNKLLTLRNFSATPHLGGNTEEALQKTGMQVVRDTLAVLNGDFAAAHRVN